MSGPPGPQSLLRAGGDVFRDGEGSVSLDLRVAGLAEYEVDVAFDFGLFCLRQCRKARAVVLQSPFGVCLVFDQFGRAHADGIGE